MKNLEEQSIEHIITRMVSDRSVDAPNDAIKYVKNLYRTRAVQPNPSLIRRVLAVIQADLAPNRATFGERSSSSGQVRQMLFDSGENAVDLRITAINNGFDIRGQILGRGFENGDIEIVNARTSIKTKIDKSNGFKTSSVPAGKYRLTIRGDKVEIVIEQLDLR